MKTFELIMVYLDKFFYDVGKEMKAPKYVIDWQMYHTKFLSLIRSFLFLLINQTLDLGFV